MAVANTLAYYNMATFTAIKMSVEQTQEEIWCKFSHSSLVQNGSIYGWKKFFRTVTKLFHVESSDQSGANFITIFYDRKFQIFVIS